MSFDLDAAKALLVTEWVENECPRCHRAMSKDDDADPVGVCGGCLYEMLDEAHEALEAERKAHATTSASLDAAWAHPSFREMQADRDRWKMTAEVNALAMSEEAADIVQALRERVVALEAERDSTIAALLKFKEDIAAELQRALEALRG